MNKKTRFRLLAMVIFLVSIDARSRNYQPENITTECRNFISEIQGSYNYGWIQNREVIDNRRSNNIYVFYYYRKNASLSNPVLFFNGGPGFSSHTTYADLEKANSRLADGQIDFIFMDQRGTGCSEGSFPIGVDDDTLIRLQGYGSEGIVNDAELIRLRLLGAQRKWKIFGQSFGAMIVYRYLQVLPNNISAAYAHANAVTISDFQRNYNRVLAEFNIFSIWAKQNPKDAYRLRVLQKYTANSNRCFMQNGLSVCGYEILSPLIGYLGFRHQWSSISFILKSLVPINQVDDIAVANFVANKIYTFFRFHDINAYEYVKTNSVFLNVSGRFDWDTNPLDVLTCRQILSDLTKKNNLTIEALWPTTCSSPVQFNYVDQIGQILDQKKNIIRQQFINISQVQQNIITFNIPLRVYSGALDSFVPPSSFLNQNSLLKKNVTYTKFANSGHEGYFTEPQIFRDLLK